MAASLLAACTAYAPRPQDLAALPAKVAAARLAERPVWTTADLLAASLTSNPQIEEAAAHYRSAAAAARTARTPPPPTLTLTAEYSKDAGGTSPWLLAGLTDIPLDLGGRRSARVATADLAVLQALYDYGEAVWAVRMALERARIERTEADQAIAAAERLAALRRDRATSGSTPRALARAASACARWARASASRRSAAASSLRASRATGRASSPASTRRSSRPARSRRRAARRSAAAMA